jgi:predicted Na+-dependent transporter
MPLPKILAIIMILSTMLGAGLQVDRRRLVETLRQYGLLGRALLANFILVPLIAVVLVRFFHVETGVATGIVLMSMAPGVPFLVNSAGRAGGGSLSFALTIAFCFAALSVLTIPITISIVLPPATAAQVPVLKFLTTLVAFQLVPLVIGALIGPRLAMPLAEKVTKLLHVVFLGATLVLVVLVFPRLVSSISSVFGFGHLLIIVAIGVFSVAIGWLLGGPDRQYRRTLSIATLMRNIGLCALIGTAPAFAHTLVVPTIVAYFLITFVISLPVRIFFKRTKDIARSITS